MAVDAVRETALKILHDVNTEGAYSNLALGQYLESRSLKEVDRGFITELVYGTIKWRLTIDWIIGQFSSVKVKKISPWIMDILRLGIYQLLFMDRIPESAACNESVELAKRYGHQTSSRFVNGLLRGVSRNKASITYPDKEKNLIQYLSVRYSFPEWIVKEWVSCFGADFAEGLMNASNQKPELTLRVNSLKTTPEELALKLGESGIKTEKGKYLKECLVMDNPPPLSRLEAFQEGLFQVQDESSMLVARILDPQPGETVMDVCSAPGGKSTHIAELMQNKGTVISRDIHEHKLKLVNEAAERLGIDIIKTELFDASLVDETKLGLIDRVLVDAPCTGLGIIRRKPDIKWGKSGSDRKEIRALQKKILEAASEYVKPGGVLIYSTCTLGPWENEEVVGEFLKDNPVFSFDSISRLLPEKLNKPEAEEGYIHLFPNIDGVDGFFISRIRRST